jgi:hypothetical protein
MATPIITLNLTKPSISPLHSRKICAPRAKDVDEDKAEGQGTVGGDLGAVNRPTGYVQDVNE